MIPTQDQTDDTVPMQPVAQFQTLSPIAMRRYMADLNRSHDELRDRLRQQEQITRNAVGVGILSVVLAAASITMTACMRATDLRADTPVAAARSSNPPVAVMVTMR